MIVLDNICTLVHNIQRMTWNVILHPDFHKEVKKLDKETRQRLAARAKLLGEFGSNLGRPHVDTLEGSNYSNMKELRFNSNNGVWRVAFAFDPERQAILLVAGDKSGVSQKNFYRKLIQKADERFTQWLKREKGK